MIMQGTIQLAADRWTVWARLNDPAVLQACIPGCHVFEQTGTRSFTAAARMGVGPIKATFRGNIVLSDIDAPNRYRIAGVGQGGVAGFAEGGADVTLSDTPEGGTLLIYVVRASLGGRLARFGTRVVDKFARTAAETFFGNLAVVLAR